MKKIIPSVICLTLLIFFSELKAQVWFPEGGYNYVQPTVFSMDNQQIYTIGKASEDLTKSYWLVAKYDGKSWIKLPILTLNKTAEVLQIKAYGGSLYVGGNFTFDNGVYAALVRFKDISWQAVAKIERINQLPPVVSALEIFDNKLIIGGNFTFIGTDSLPYLAAYNGISFSNILTKVPTCKKCFPNYLITDLAANDSFLAISGYFYQIAERNSKSLFLLKINGKSDTFAAAPNNLLFDKIALQGKTIIGAGVNSADKSVNIYKAESSFTSLKYNFDTIFKLNDMVIFDNSLWMNGIAKLTGKLFKGVTHQLVSTTWVDYSNNYPGAKSILSGRGSLWAIGNADKPLSIWNTNKHLVRLYMNSALVKVKVFLDSNNNCVQEKPEKNLSKQLVKLSLPLINKFSVTNELGMAEFLFNIPNGSAKVPFSIILPRNFKTSNCSFDTIYKSFQTNIKYADSIQFPVTRKNNINDIRVIIDAPKGTQVMKDKRMQYVITLENTGSNIVSGILTLKKNTWLTSEKIDGNGILDTSKVRWSYANMNPGEKRFFNYSGVASDARFVDNTILQAQASATIASVVNNYAKDDIDSIEQTIDNSSNPFRKDIYPLPKTGDSISYLTLKDREIRYNINFSNYGTDTVYNAVITDTLDLNLDMSYIEETGSNKNYYTEIQTDPNNSYKGVIIWHFPNINLTPNPTKNFELPSSGSYIGFKVVMKPLSNGYIVKNTAAVFYDNYYEGRTNTAYCTIVNTGLNTIKSVNNSLLLVPNPASNKINFQLPLNYYDQIIVFNQEGKRVIFHELSEASDSHTLDIDFLNNGIYVLQVIKGNQLYSSKFVKM